MLAKGCLLSKRCDIGPDGFPSRSPKCCQMGGFPLRLLHHVTASETGLPLSTHFNPQQTVHRALSLGVFPNNPHRFLASFAATVSKQAVVSRPRHPQPTEAYSPPPLKAGYTAPSYHRYAGFLTQWVSLHGCMGGPACHCGFPIPP